MNHSANGILLGGVPFGRDNIGDEAILQCVVQLIRQGNPDALITASTDQPESTAEKLGIQTCSLFGFEPPGYDPDEMRRVIGQHEVFVWAGATGLSDYPDYALAVLEEAQRQGKRTAIFCTGMNDRFNPFLYSLLPGKRRNLYTLLRRLTLGSLDLIAVTERRLKTSVRHRLASALSKVDLLVTRDPESTAQLQAILGKEYPILTGADPALVLPSAPLSEIPLSDKARGFLDSSSPRIGLCISSQSPVREMESLAVHLDRVMEKHKANLVCIPMNPITDAALMRQFVKRLGHPERTVVLEDFVEPEWVATIAGKMDVVVSSRLHLLILASNSLTPIAGISRGSKVTNFTGAFGVPDLGSTDQLDGDRLESVLDDLLRNAEDFRQRAGKKRAEMLKRLDAARQALDQVIESAAHVPDSLPS